MKTKTLITAVSSFFIFHSALAFEGRITAALTCSGQATPLLYTAGTNCLRVEVTALDRPNPVDLLDLPSGEMTLLFPNNRSFVRLKPAAENAAAVPPGFPAMPPGVGPQPQFPAAPPSIGPTNLPGMPAPPAMPQMPAMPMMPPPMMEKMELTATGDKTNLLGFACEKYELKQRGETMEIWATDQLFPFQPYQQSQRHRFGPRMIEEQWGDLLKAKKLFPLLAVLRFELPSAPEAGGPPAAGPDRLRFEVKSIVPEKITDETLFQSPPDYQEVRPLPF
jgi:hypothetical protein